MHQIVAKSKTFAIRSLVFVATAVGTVGCQTEKMLEPSADGQGLKNTSVVSQSVMRTMDDEFAIIADSVPGFGGFFYRRDGQLVVYMKDPASYETYASQIGQKLEQFHRGPVTPGDKRIAADLINATVMRGNYSFRELLTIYRTKLDAILPAISGLVLTDIDEAQNRIVVSVNASEHVADARRMLSANGLTEELVSVAVSGVAQPNSLLNDPLRPVPGGARLRIGSSVGTKCTLGFNLLKYMGTYSDTVATDRFFVSAAHCTSTQWGLDYSQGYQGGSFMATEVGDPAAFTGAPCMAGKICRYTEASLFKFYDDSITSNDGQVAYPTSIGDTSFTTLKTLTSVDSPYSGMSLHLIGATSGRRLGYVTSTCSNVYNVAGWGNKELLCQGIASYFSGPGDSGAPVITLYGDGTVSATGMHWGNTTVNGVWQTSIFTPTYAILDEFFYNLPGYQNFSPVVY